MNRILILEDEGMLRASMAKGLNKLPDIEVVDAGTFNEALRFIDEKPPNLILSDLDLPDRSGLELLGALGTRGLRIPIVFISAYLKAYGGQIPPHANVEVREKPIALEELRKLVKQHLGVRESSPFSVADYLQIASMGQHSVEITLEWDEGHAGRIVVVNGQLWGAEDSWGHGADSFKRLAMATDVAIACTALRGDPGDRNITGSLEHMLLEAAQHLDEMGHAGTLDVFTGDDAAAAAAAAETSFAGVEEEVAGLVSNPGMTPPPAHHAPPAPGYAQPAPGYAQPAPAGYAQPQPGYAQPHPGYAQPQPGYAQPQPGYAQPAPPQHYAQPAQPAPVPAAPPPAPEPPPPPVEDFKSLFAKANEAILDRNYEQALEYLRKADEMKPDDPKVLRLMTKLEKKKS